MTFQTYCKECESELEFEIEFHNGQHGMSGPEECGNCHAEVDDDGVMEEFESEMREGG